MEELIVDKWDSLNINKFYDVLISLKNEEKIEWAKNIINTKNNFLAISCGILRKIAKEIYKGDYISFLDLMPHDYHEATIVDAYLISLIKDFKLQKKYILKLSKYIDNWATVDSIKFNIKGSEDEYINFSNELVKSNKPFTRRIGIRILFQFTSYQEYSDDIFDVMDSFFLEEHYYVNMANAWLFCEMFINNRDNTVNYLKRHKLNKFTINKGISKCRDSYRVSKDDKEMLINYRVK